MMVSLVFMGLLMMLDFNNLYGGMLLFMYLFFMLICGYNLIGLNDLKGDLFSVMGVDSISLYLILLLMWMISLILMMFGGGKLSIFFVIMFLSIGGMFIVLDLVLMYFFFESSMVPMFLMILFFGKSGGRYLSAVYMFVYTMFSSLPALTYMCVMFNYLGSVSIDYLVYSSCDLDDLGMWFIITMFLIKMPMFFFHIWLPKAHVDAPVYGSMLLASVMLKMGGYGLIRCLMIIDSPLDMDDSIYCFSLAGMIFLSYMCLHQVDLKVLVAYSSIIHMGIAMIGLSSGDEIGYVGGIIVMMSHGICSSGLFYLVNEIYNISSSRLNMFNKGLMSMNPILTMIWLIMLMNNLSVPPCFGILGELMVFTSCMLNSLTSYLGLVMYVFSMSCFIMNMFISLMGGGDLFEGLKMSVNINSLYCLFMHLLPLNFFFFFF